MRSGQEETLGGPSAPFVSVIVPVLNGEEIIKDCLTSLLRVDYPPERREILVVDNGSTDRTAEIIQSFPVRYLREERRGLSYARNRGIEDSAGDIAAFIDADCVVTTRWLRELVHGFANEAVGIVAGELVTYPPKTPAERYTAMRKPLWQARSLRYTGSPWFNSGNAAFRCEVFDLIGLFDPQFAGVGCEDIDFAWRFLQSTRFKLVYSLKALAFHRHRVTTRGLFKQYLGYGRGQAILARKYPKRLPWGWRRELEAYKDLFLATLAIGRVATGSKPRGRETTDFSYHYLELVRKLGERIGFTSGMLRRAKHE